MLVRLMEKSNMKTILLVTLQIPSIFKRHWDDMILLYALIGFMCVFVFLWIIGTILSILKNGPRSSLTAKIVMAPFYMMVDAIALSNLDSKSHLA